MRDYLTDDLQKVDLVNREGAVDTLCSVLGVDTEAGKQFVRYSLANALLMNRKQHDYGPSNIAETGVPGCVIRMSDKVKRLLNLYGFATGRKKKPRNESVDDTFRDVANYGIIALMVKRGQWPLQ